MDPGFNVSWKEFQALKELVKENTEHGASLGENMDSFFIITMGIIVFLIQGGFAFLECGAVRAKNATNILMKNMLDAFLGAIAYWLVGWSLGQSDGNRFIGYTNWASHNVSGNGYARWFYHYVFAATASTIVSGAVAERCDFIAYMIYSTIITGIVYPIPTHWVWHPQGWLAQGIEVEMDNVTYTVSYMDFAGSGTLHTLGGLAALVAAIILGPRIGRFDEDGNPVQIKGHSVPLTALGGFMLFFGFFAFNSGSQGSIAAVGDNEAIALIAVNTILSGSACAMTCLVIQHTIDYCTANKRRRWSLLTTINGGLAGMISSCSAVNAYHPWTAFVLGIIAGPVYMLSSWTMLKYHIDDPLDAVSVHAAAGFLGVIAAPIGAGGTGIIFGANKVSGMQLAWNLVGISVTFVWTVCLSAVIFGSLRLLKIFRVSPEMEEKGMDVPKHGEPAYPKAAYGDGWQGRRGTLVGFEPSKQNISGAPKLESINEVIIVDQVTDDKTAL